MTVTERVDAWQGAWPDPLVSGTRGMAEKGLFALGLTEAPGYTTIARVKDLLVEKTGLLGLAGMWAGRQMISRFFLGRFGTPDHITFFMPRLADGTMSFSVAISEPGVGAHPKHLTTRAVADGDDVLISGEKAWVSNALAATHVIVFAVRGETPARKLYSAFLVPCETPGLTITPMPGFHALAPSMHCAVRLDNCRVPACARLGPEGTAFETMAMPFRDVEDAVGAAGMAGAFRCLARALAPHAAVAAHADLGAIAGLTALLDHGAGAVVGALDAGRMRDEAAASVGLRVLAADIRARIGALIGTIDPPVDPARDRMLGDLDAILGIARGPRAVRQARLGASFSPSRG